MLRHTLLALLTLVACEPEEEAGDVQDESADNADDAALNDRLDALEAQHAADVATLTARLDAAAAEVAALSTEVEALEADKVALEEALGQSDLALAEAEARLDALEVASASTAAMSRLSSVLSVDAAGDLALDGVNLWIRSGAGATDATPNGKGNLILGYGEALGGEARTGSHTIVVGPYHSWTAAWGIVSGESNGLYADGGALVGGKSNTVNHANAVDAGGTGVSSTYTCGFRGSGLQSGSGC